jgi:hypothetical protein
MTALLRSYCFPTFEQSFSAVDQHIYEYPR